MSSSHRFCALLLFAVLCIPVSLQAQAPAKPPVKTPRGTISGRVTIKDKPAAGVTVGLRQPPGFGIPMTEKFYRGITDSEGVYRITNVPAGTYEIFPSAPAYVSIEANTPRGKNVIVGEDENVEDINFSLVRGGVITGKITDADGRPLIQQQVYLYRAGDFLQQPLRQVYAASNLQTDDRGVYRFFGLAAGRYKVAAGRGDDIYGSNYYQPTRVTYKQVFHPNETDQTKATIIEVREGSETANIDITLGSPVQTFNVTGRVVDAEKGVPVPNIRFGFQRRAGERFEYVESNAVSNVKGDFIAEGLVPGKYAVLMFGNQETELRVESLTFDIVDADLSGVTIRLMKGSSISGVVVLEPDDKKAFAKLAEMQLRGYVSAPQGAASVGASTFSAIAADGSFRLWGLAPGQLNLWLTGQMGMNQPKGYTLLRVEHNGVALPRGIEIKEGDQLSGVRIIVAYGTASIHGVVKVENGPLPDGARMVARVFRPGTPPTGVANSPVDARGQFLIEGLPAGVYEVQVMAFAPNQKGQISSKREVNVQDGVINEFTITLDATPQPLPQQPKP
ncbi:MAG TPA: carboxypeptidase-like regulatory domain-containing protein [Pyrinomonadaceae bacterium]|nr:carboxypeptidase-like regulatory domain-containing protein [Pyrinomonadaceae bacterium]